MEPGTDGLERGFTPRSGLLVLGALGAAIGTALALWLFVRFDQLEATPWSARLASALGVAVLLHGMAHAINGVRLARLSQGTISWLRGWAIVTVGVFGAATTPARIGGEALKAIELRRRLAWPATVSLLLAERMFDLVVLAAAGALVVAALAGIAGAGDAMLSLMLAVGALLAVALVVASFAWIAKRQGAITAGTGKLASLRATLHEGLRGLAALSLEARALATGLTVVVWALEISGFVAVAWMLSVPINWLGAAILVLGVTLVQALPLLPSGAGTVDAYAVLVAPALGANVGAAYLVWRAAVLSYDLVLGGVVAAVRLLGYRPSVTNEPSHRIQDQSGNQ